MTLPLPLPQHHPGRRRWLVAGVASAATAAGAGLYWLQHSNDAATQYKHLPLWDMEFESPGSTKVRMAGFSGKPLVLNFWATWCPPCIEEFPLLEDFYQKNSANGWQVLGLAIDQIAAVQLFLKHNPVNFSIALAGAPGIELSRTLGNLSGGLPFTVVFSADRRIIQRKMGRVSTDDLRAWSTLR